MSLTQLVWKTCLGHTQNVGLFIKWVGLESPQDWLGLTWVGPWILLQPSWWDNGGHVRKRGNASHGCWLPTQTQADINDRVNTTRRGVCIDRHNTPLRDSSLVTLLWRNMDIICLELDQFERGLLEVDRTTDGHQVGGPPHSLNIMAVVSWENRGYLGRDFQATWGRFYLSSLISTLMANVVMVQKVDTRWHMYVDFKNLNASRPK